MCDRRVITVLIEIAADSIIRIHKSTDDRIIVSTGEIIQSRFYVIDVPPSYVKMNHSLEYSQAHFITLLSSASTISRVFYNYKP